MKAKAIAKKFSLAGNYKTENVIIVEMSRKDVNFQRFPTLDAKKLVNAPKMSAHHRGICHF